MALGAQASAQVRVRDHRKLKPAPKIQVSSFSPQSGAVGTTVTISGSGFTPKTKVYFGGYQVRPKRITPTAITLAVPRRYGDGAIVLRHPGVARDIRVGSFAIDAPPEVHGFAPTSGVAGTRVAIRGKRFRRDDTVTLAGQPVQVIAVTPGRITIAIPAQAATGKLAVVRAGGVAVTSKRTFTVVQPAPTITRLDPPGGGPGEQVRVTGTNLTPSDTLRYGKRPMQIIRRGANFVDAVIPMEARNNRYLWLNGPNGEARSPVLFKIERPPVIQRIAPAYGTVGQRVEIFGTDFRAGDRVSINGLQCRIMQLRRHQISAIVPNGAHSGAIEVERGSLRVASSKPFEVVYAPTIARFDPNAGEVGTQVTITGTSLTPDADVFYGNERLRVIRRARNDTTLVVRIPPRASDQPFTVRTRGGEASSNQSFRVYWWPKISDVSPRAAYPGSQLTLLGTHLDYVEAIRLESTALRVLNTAPDGSTMVVEIPHDMRASAHGAARRGKHRRGGSRISYTSFGREFKTNHRIELKERPTLTGYSPATGAPGSEVLINGTNLTGNTLAYFGNTPMQVVSRNLPTQIIARIPAIVRGADHIWLEDGEARVRSHRPFAVVAPPGITSFSPSRGKPGTQVTIHGQDIGANVEVLLGNVPCRVVSRRGNNIAVEVPVAAPGGNQYFVLRDKQLSSQSQKPFQVIPVAYIDRFAPTQGPPGTQIVIYGRDFRRKTRVYFGNIELRVTSVDRDGKRMTVALPPDVTGSAAISVYDQGVRSQSSAQFRVLQPPPPRGGVKVRDHR